MPVSTLAPPVVTETPPENARAGFIKKHPVLTYYALTFAISWGALAVLVAGWTGIVPTAQQAASLLPVVFLITIAGPAIAGLALIGLVDGREGYRDFAARFRRWRVGGRWWAIALLTGPLVFTVAVLVDGATFAAGLPAIIASEDKASVLVLAIVAGLVVGACEETGWTGFAIPRFRLLYGVFGAGLVAGILWGVWHMPSQFWGSGDASGALNLTLLTGETIFAMAVLPAYRILMVWVYDHTQSLIVAMLMHAVLVACLFVVVRAGISDAAYLTCCLTIAVGMWLVIAAVGVLTHGRFTRELSPTPIRGVSGGLRN
jgi:CAAX protease family protein